MNTKSAKRLKIMALASLIFFSGQSQAGLFGGKSEGHLGKDGCLYKDASLSVRIPTEENVIAIDQSEAFSPTQKEQVKQTLTAQMLDDQSVPVGSHVTVYAFGKDDFKYDGSGQTIKPVLSVCKPSHEGNEWTQNVKKMERKFQSEFMGRLNAEIDKATSTALGGRSPIMEMIQFISLESAISLGSEGKPKHLTMVTDLLQNSEAYSDYRQKNGQKSEPSSSLITNLKGWDVKVLSIKRYGKDQLIQDQSHSTNWTSWFEKSGATSATSTVIP